MIAREQLPTEPPQPRTGTRSGRTAVALRRARARRRRYKDLARLFTVVGALTLGVVIYLALLANVTKLNYELAHSARERARLVDESGRLDDQIARLESREHLADVAARLGMQSARAFAQIEVPPEHTNAPAPGIAFLTWLK